MRQDHLPKAVLTVYIGGASNLPHSKRTTFAGLGPAGFSEPNPYCVIKAEEQTAKSHILFRTTNPVFNYVAQFLIRNPDIYDVVTEIRDKRAGDALISQIRTHLSDVFNSPDMCLEINHQLRFVGAALSTHGAAGSRIFIRYTMKILEGGPRELNDYQIDPDRFSVTTGNICDSQSISQVNGHDATLTPSTSTGTLKRIFFRKRKSRKKSG
ncbi:hypothetical protein ACOME3_006431 [Neoechinorhynchus agilis]